MKQFITYIVLAVAMLCFASCNTEKKTMEKILVESVKSPSTYKTLAFEPSEVVTLADEVANRIEFFEQSLSFDKEQYKDSEKNANDKFYSASFRETYRQRADMYKAEVEKDQKMLDHLKQISTTYPNEYNKPSFTIYKLTYESANGFGAILKDYCYGRFDNEGNLVAIKLSEDSSWVLLRNFWSIPKYYELI